MVRSMTGFGAAEGAVGSRRLRVEIRTVNHRFFNFAPRLPAELAPLEAEIRERLRREFDRGHVALGAQWAGGDATGGAGELTVNLERARLAADQLGALQRALGLGGSVELKLVARQPEVLVWERPAATEVAWREVEPVVVQAAAECRAMREREGSALGAEMELRLGSMERALGEIEELAPARLARERERVRGAVEGLLAGRPVDDGRLLQEVALLADRLDITEELVRFRTHVGACRAALAGTAPAGKTLGFLAQELGREINTVGSKANDAAIAARVVAVKGELEKFREQVENLE